MCPLERKEEKEDKEGEKIKTKIKWIMRIL
jgi:hypothetical protein